MRYFICDINGIIVIKKSLPIKRGERVEREKASSEAEYSITIPIKSDKIKSGLSKDGEQYLSSARNHLKE